ncbi:MAG: hypothetical protein IPM13_16100 [Phycisphaerales bacterium]|nr:hypothetical protein [Phycisphaerales bacterium]
MHRSNVVVAGLFLACGVVLLQLGCAPAPVRVVSVNLADMGLTSAAPDWEAQRTLLLDLIRSERPDILALQNVGGAQLTDLQPRMGEYAAVAVGADDGSSAGDMTPILYRRSRFTRVDEGAFWLSEQPRRPGTIGWDAAEARVATWIQLRPLDAPQTDLRVVNVRFDPQGEVARRESARLVRRFADALGGQALLVTGAFSCPPAGEPLRILREDRGDSSELRDALDTPRPSRAQPWYVQAADAGAEPRGRTPVAILINRGLRRAPAAASTDTTAGPSSSAAPPLSSDADARSPSNTAAARSRRAPEPPMPTTPPGVTRVDLLLKPSTFVLAP